MEIRGGVQDIPPHPPEREKEVREENHIQKREKANRESTNSSGCGDRERFPKTTRRDHSGILWVPVRRFSHLSQGRGEYSVSAAPVLQRRKAFKVSLGGISGMF